MLGLLFGIRRELRAQKAAERAAQLEAEMFVYEREMLDDERELERSKSLQRHRAAQMLIAQQARDKRARALQIREQHCRMKRKVRK